MRHAAARRDFVAQRAFAAHREFVLRRLAIDEVPAAAALARSYKGPSAIALLPDDEQQRQTAHAFRKQVLDGLNHGRDDALGVAGAAAPDPFAVVSRRVERWNGI